jgi:hypothetical protein
MRPSPDREESNLLKARSSIVWLLAMAVAFGAVYAIEKYSRAAPAAASAAASTAPAELLAASPGQPALPASRPLTEQERAWAATAWAYFEKNTDPKTGLAGSVEGYPGATMWDIGSGLLALVAARDLDMLTAKEFDERVGRALGSLARLPLYADALPNKAYDVRTLQMTDYGNQPVAGGIGWSALDIGRLLVPLDIIVWRHPLHATKVRAVVARWKTAQLARGGQLFGQQAGGQATQEGRLGYEQYAARAVAPLGLDLDQAGDWRAHLKLVDVEGVGVPLDARDPARFGAPDFVVSEPYLLGGLEFGWQGRGREAAWRVLRAQEERFRKTGTLTAVIEDHLDREPRFAYASVYAGGKPWAVVDDKGRDLGALRTLSVKAAFGWHALFRTDYTQQLVQAVAPLNDPKRGWFAGRYEQDGQPNAAVAANTNAVVLESLAFIQRGALLGPR